MIPIATDVSCMPKDREGERKSFGYIDLDGFSAINNEHGHDFGDDVLNEIEEFGNEFAGAKEEFKREYGQGDEFLLILEETDKESAEEHMEEFRKKLEDLEPNGEKVTASIGVATYPDDGEDEEDTINTADQAMLNAEDWGGNKVIAAGKEIPTKEIEVWFEELMRVDEGDLVRIEMWIDRGTTIRAAKIFNEENGITTSSHIAGTVMSADKIREPVEGIVSEITEMNSNETRFSMRAEESRLEELGLG